MTDSEAVVRCQNGDRDAFRHLVDQYKDVLIGTAVLMTGNRATAEEHVQEAFLSAWRGIRRFRQGRPVKPWFLRILVNTILSWRRKGSVPEVYLTGHGSTPRNRTPRKATSRKPWMPWRDASPCGKPSPTSARNIARWWP